MFLQIALDTPLRCVFDYRPPASSSDPPESVLPWVAPPLGVRVRVPFGRRRLVGILVGISLESSVAADKLKSALEILDQHPVFDPATFELLRWAAEYYHQPPGAVFAAALPASLRKGQPTQATPPKQAKPAKSAKRGSKSAAKFTAQPVTAQAVTAQAVAAQPAVASPMIVHPSDVELNAGQAQCVAALSASLSGFTAHLLQGVTGSGKTEVYLRVIAAAIAESGQALVLVPEIALTPQLVARFRARFSSGVIALHSGLTQKERRDAWRAAHSGAARIVIGTRSAVFTSLPKLALIVVDEEHDASYKQQEGFRYSARDLAVVRARLAQVPVILGSATPSLETLENAATGRYARHLLPLRPGAATAPRMALVDLRKHASEQGLSTPAMQAIERHLGAGGQVIVFLNRRGYAPSLFCNACGWVAPCAHCDARMTLHRRARQLRCHHCGAHGPVPETCGNCGQPLNPVGQGTERVEETLARLFPQAPLARLDRDTASARGAIQSVLERVHSGEARILVGTQMLTKGHHFPDVSLVVILDADQGLFASDFRASERLAQTITQVAGRAGRGRLAGEVLIQTEFPDHPLLRRLTAEGYEGFAIGALEERREAGWPPYSRLAMLRAEAKDSAGLDAFLREALRAGDALVSGGAPVAGGALVTGGGALGTGRARGAQAVKVLGPATALMARRADHFRAHLLIETASRSALQRFLKEWLPRVETLSGPTGLRWSIDVDPLEVD